METPRRIGIRAILFVSKNFGAGVGTILRPLPPKLKGGLVRAGGHLRDHLPRPLWSAVRPGVYEFIRALYFGTGQHCSVSRAIAPGLFMDLDVSQKAQRRIYTERVYESSMVAYFANEIKNGDGFVDVGANCGYYTLLASRWVGPQGAVHAFEPEVNNFRRLQAQVERNHCANVVLHHAAAGAAEGSMTLNLNPLNEGGHSLKPFDAYFDDAREWSREEVRERFRGEALTQTVEVMPLGEVLASGGRHWHMKIDVEGAEIDALRGARSFIKETRPDICCEISGDTPELHALLEDLQYEVYNLHSDGSLKKLQTAVGPGNYVLKPVNP